MLKKHYIYEEIAIANFNWPN